MKKIILLFVVFCMSVSVFAGDRAAEMKNLRNKIVKMEILTREELPFPFDYKGLEQKDQEAIDIFYEAKSKYEKNPDNFAAVYNYAMLIIQLSTSNGYLYSDAELEQAYKILEQAQKINPDYLPLYQEQVGIVEKRLFTNFVMIPSSFWEGSSYNSASYVNPKMARSLSDKTCLSYRIDAYIHNSIWADRLLHSIKNQIRLGVNRKDYFLEAAVIYLVSYSDFSSYDSYLAKAGEDSLKKELSRALYSVTNDCFVYCRGTMNLAKKEQAIRKLEKVHLDRLKRYFGQYLPDLEAYHETLQTIQENKKSIAKKRNQAFSQQLGQQINAK